MPARPSCPATGGPQYTAVGAWQGPGLWDSATMGGTSGPSPLRGGVASGPRPLQDCRSASKCQDQQPEQKSCTLTRDRP